MLLQIKVDGHIQLSRNLRILARELPNLKEFFEETLDIVTARTAEVFNSSGGAVAKAGTWPPLSAKTIKARDKRWGYYKRAPNRPGVLRWTGALQDQVTRQTSNQSGTLVHTARSSNGYNYPLAHQRGGGNVPKRVIIDLSPQTVSEIQRALQGHVQRKIGVFGRQI